MAKMSDLLTELLPGAFLKEDGGDDAGFCAPARLVTHIDEAATRALTAYYRAHPAGCGRAAGSDVELGEPFATGGSFRRGDRPGMNAEELRSNPRLSRSFVQDLNRLPILPL